jgi:hypothetical protein
MRPHPLVAVLDAAVAGSFPPPDGVTELFPPDPWGWSAVVALTGHAYVLADVDRAALDALGADGFGGASHPDVLRRIAGPGGEIGSLDAMLVGHGEVGAVLPGRDDADDHPRVSRAREHRRDVEVYGDDAGLVILGHGLAGRREIAVELLDPAGGGAGHGRRLIRAGLAALAPGEPVWAQVSPGNAQSLRAFLACGFVPIGSEVLIRPHGDR